MRTSVGIQSLVFCWSFLGCLSGAQGHLLCTCFRKVPLWPAFFKHRWSVSIRVSSRSGRHTQTAVAGVSSRFSGYLPTATTLCSWGSALSWYLASGSRLCPSESCVSLLVGPGISPGVSCHRPFGVGRLSSLGALSRMVHFQVAPSPMSGFLNVCLLGQLDTQLGWFLLRFASLYQCFLPIYSFRRNLELPCQVSSHAVKNLIGI